jgi:hypothetical protein
MTLALDPARRPPLPLKGVRGQELERLKYPHH